MLNAIIYIWYFIKFNMGGLLTVDQFDTTMSYGRQNMGCAEGSVEEIERLFGTTVMTEG